ncbi:MAG: hypothetical protein SPF38_05640 [Dysosmobacter sp.]|nr:hypothetical protein [Dysosmobacter sp.]
MRRLNRKQKTVRNFSLAALCALLTWALAGFPAITRDMMLWRAARENAVTQWQEVYAEPDHTASSYETEAIYLRSGDDFWCLRHHGLKYIWSVHLYDCEGILVTPSREHPGALLAMGDVDAASAELTWSLLRQEVPLTRTVSGQRQIGEVFLFPMPKDITEAQRAFLENMAGNEWARERLFDYTLRLYNENGVLIQETYG